MPQLDREGRFKGSPVTWGIREVANKPLFEVEYRITKMLDGDWVDWSEYDMKITGEYWLIMNNGNPNKGAIDVLKECFGWSGHSMEDLQTHDWSQVEVQLTVETESWTDGKGNNKSKLKVKWTNPGDSTVASKVSGDKLKQLDSVWGAKLRALAGPPPAKQPANANGSPPLKPTAAKGGCTIEVAWDAFCKEFAVVYPDATQEVREKNWNKILGHLVPHKTPDAFNELDWGIVRDQSPKEIVPF